MIQIKNGVKKYDKQVLFSNLNLCIQKNGIHVVCGESGSGKTTLLNIIAGFETLTTGEMTINGDVATIFQNYELIEEFNVKENIYLYSKLKNKNNAIYEKEIIEILSLEELFEHYPKELSGGQKQRVGIARALLQEPSIILCDEPTESLDIDNKIKVMELLKTISKSCIVILVTHDQALIENYYDVCYEIVDKSIDVKYRNKITSDNIQLESSSVNTGLLFKTINKIICKKTSLISLIISFMSIVLCCLIAFENNIFTNENELFSLTKDVIYLDSEEDLLESGENVIPILKMNSFSINNKTYHIKIYPATVNEMNEFIIKGKISEGLEVVVNQVLASSLGNDVLNKTVKLKYIINNVNYDVDTQIVGIVSESLETPMMYFIQDNYEEYLKTQLTEDKEIQYDVFLKKNKFYRYDVLFNDIEHIGKRFVNYNLEIISPLYDQYIQEKNDKILFYYLYKLIEVFILLFIIISILVVTKRDVITLTRSFSIILASNVSIKKLKIIYILIKSFIYFIVYLFCMATMFTLINYLNLMSKEMIYIAALLLLIKLLLIFTYISKIKKSNVSVLLKNSLDR